MSNAIADKIRKLLALAGNNPNENEAAAALERATELMMKHGIEEASLKTDTIKIDYYGATVEGDHRWQGFCAQAAGRLAGAAAVFVKTRDGMMIRFAGREENCTAACNMAIYIIDQVERTYKAFLPKGLSKTERAEYRRTFKEACAARVFDRADQIVKSQSEKGLSGVNALVVVDHRKQLLAETQEFFAQVGVRTQSKAAVIRHGNGSQEGYQAGNTVRLQKGVE